MMSREFESSADHVSPDVLAAWMEGTLSSAERSAAEAHAADCAHCQAMLAAMARTAPPAPARAWWSAPAVRWFVPVAAATLVIATWVGVTRLRHASATAAVKSVSAAVESMPSVPPAPAPAAEPQAFVAERTKSPEAKSEPAKMATRAGKDREVRGRAESVALPARSDTDRARVDVLASAAPAAPTEPSASPLPLATATQPAAAVPQAPPAANAAGASPAAQTPPPPVPLLPLQETVVVGGAAAQAKSTTRDAAARTAPVEVMSPERTYRWRSVTPGSILYSMDGGTNWRRSATGSPVVVRAGSAPSRTVCWLVGQAGTVLLTIDGQSWQVRPFPERVDLIDVRASDARTATVTTADRRRFATTDSGATWSPLQDH